MSWNLMSWLPKRNAYKRAPKKKPTFKPQIEQLETRRLLSTVQFSTSPFQVDEDAGTIYVTVTLSQGINDYVDVVFDASQGTAEVSTDFSANTLITFDPYQTVHGVQIDITDDEWYEGNEYFVFSIDSISSSGTPPTPTAGSPSAITITITDDDPEPVATLSAPSSISEGGGSAMATVSLSSQAGNTVTITYSTVAGTAEADSDFSSADAATLELAAGQTIGYIYVDIENDSYDEFDETFQLELDGATNASLGTSISATITINDDDAAPTVTLSPESVYEDAGNATVSVYLTQASGKTITLNYATSDGTAKAASDFTDTDGSLSISPGTTYTTFLVPITDDSTDEEDEYYYFNTSNVQNAALGSPATQTATIFDDDDPPDAYLTTTAYSVNENAGSVSIYVELSVASEKTVTVDYFASDGTAIGGEGSDYDYTPVSDTLTFNPGETSKYFTVPITNDSIDEDPEEFTAYLMSANNATVSNPDLATITITDDDPEPSVTLSAPASVDESVGYATMTATLSAESAKTITVDYDTSDGTALESDYDYTPTTGTLTFYPGMTYTTFSVPINDDSKDEPDEDFGVSLSNPSNASLGTSLASVTITDNDDPPTIEFTSSWQSVSENVGTTSVTLQLSNESGKDITVPVSIGGDADNGDDYSIKPIPLTITLTAGTTASVIPIEIYKDLLVEKDEDIVLTLGTPTNATLGYTTTHTATISGNYAPPTIPNPPNNNLGDVLVDYKSGDIIIDHDIDIPPGGG